jgi:hypothetical protein
MASVLIHRGALPEADETGEDRIGQKPLRLRVSRLSFRQRLLLALALLWALALAAAAVSRVRGDGARSLDGMEPFLAQLRRRRDGAITVVVPCFRQRPFIGETLRSLAAQTFPPVSIVVVDDATCK